MCKPFETQYTQEIVCPHCGYEFSDSWEIGDYELLSCPSCWNEFCLYRWVEVTYCTAKKEVGDEN
jgi:hypothetical protein